MRVENPEDLFVDRSDTLEQFKANNADDVTRVNKQCNIKSKTCTVHVRVYLP